MDFYRRFILSGYCVALAYRPLDDIQVELCLYEPAVYCSDILVYL